MRETSVESKEKILTKFVAKKLKLNSAFCDKPRTTKLDGPHSESLC